MTGNPFIVAGAQAGEVEKFLARNPQFKNTKENVQLLLGRIHGLVIKRKVDAESLQWALNQYLQAGWDKQLLRNSEGVQSVAPTPPPQPVIEVVAAPEPEVPEHELPGFPVKLQIESGWSYSIRVSTFRENRAKQLAREQREAEVARNSVPHASTLQNTKAEMDFRRARAEKFERDKSAVRFEEPEHKS